MVAVEDGRYHYTAGSDVREARRISTNLPFILGSLVMLLIIGIVGCMDQISSSDEKGVTRSTVAANVGYDRAIKPYIYQFDVVSQEGGESVRKIPYIWNQVWESAGWTPIKLMVGKYAADPQYQDVLDLVENANLLQKRTVYKYLAMAASGGGWLAHSDTFPLHPFGTTLSLPNKGSMTAYNGPCLMSANSTEWLRMGRKVAEHARVYHLPDQWTEEMAVDQLQLHYTLVKDQVFEVPKVDESAVQWSWAPQHCQLTKRSRAVHFRLGEHEDFASLKDPGDMVIKWLSMWLQSCERSTHFVDEERRTKSGPNDGLPVTVAGSFHTPNNYIETRAIVIADEGRGEALKDEARGSVGVTTTQDKDPVQAGSFHVATNYNETRQEETRTLRATAMAMGSAK